MKKKIIFATTFIFITTIGFLIFKFTTHHTQKKQEDFLVSLVKVQVEKLNPTIETFGTVVYKTKNEITNLVAGKVIKKHVKEGDFIKKGQVLYTLKNVELEIQYSQHLNNLNSAQANLNLFQARLTQREQEIASQFLQIENKQLQIEQLKNKITSSKEKLNKSKDLNELGGVTEQAIKDMNDELFNLETNLQITQKELEMISLGFQKEDLLNAGITPAQDKSSFKKQIIQLNTKTSQADLQVALAEFENSKKTVELTEKLLQDLIIKSPITGIVGITYFEEGEYINTNEKVLMIMDTSNCLASINVQESNIFDISLGSKTSIEIPAINKFIESTVSEIAPYADTATGLFNIKSNFENKDNLIKPGMFLKCKIQNDNQQEYIKIPETALINISDKNAECFSVKNNLAISEKIKIEFIKDGTAFLKEGLKKDQLIINQPSNKLKEGTRVKVL